MADTLASPGAWLGASPSLGNEKSFMGHAKSIVSNGKICPGKSGLSRADLSHRGNGEPIRSFWGNGQAFDSIRGNKRSFLGYDKSIDLPTT